MNTKEFIEEFTETLQCEETIDMTTVLDDLEEWDSLSLIATIALFSNKFGLSVNANKVKECKTVADVVLLAGDKISD